MFAWFSLQATVTIYAVDADVVRPVASGYSSGCDYASRRQARQEYDNVR